MVQPAEWDVLARLCVKHDLKLVCDEVWEAMVFDGTPHISPLAIPALRERSVKIGSAGKIFSLTGWKVGWACAAAPIAAVIARAHQFLTFTTPPSLQWAVAEGLALPSDWHEAHRGAHGEGRTRLARGLSRAGYAVIAGPATWFIHVDLAASGIALPDSLFYTERLIVEAGVASIPISAFYEEAPETGYVRFCFAKADDVLDEAIGRAGAVSGGIGWGVITSQPHTPFALSEVEGWSRAKPRLLRLRSAQGFDFAQGERGWLGTRGSRPPFGLRLPPYSDSPAPLSPDARAGSCPHNPSGTARAPAGSAPPCRRMLRAAPAAARTR